MVGVLGGEHRVEPVDGEIEVLGTWPSEARARGVVVGAVGLKEVARVAELIAHVATVARSSVDVTNRTTRSATAAVSLRRLWSAPGITSTERPGAGGGMPNGSRSPCTTRTGQDGNSSSSSLLFSGLPGGCSGYASAITPIAPRMSAVRQATRAPFDRP